ncbi:hypothetical protein HPB52_022306 [Rhipicephalus sanguineus]|uniref:Uncharacterized protein n=1 Tax=Rhipicephalus sanguineus TaxID=34632 RepID=A0A9D4Q2X2_RHISA|nr:hypothetical protein HPB52_022306 [Rhipicephalus sanguineus]
MVTTGLDSAALLLETQIAVDDQSTDLPEHAEVRRVAAEPSESADMVAPFTESQVREVIAAMPPQSSPVPHAITSLLVKGLFKIHARFIMLVFNAAPRSATSLLLAPGQDHFHPEARPAL